MNRSILGSISRPPHELQRVASILDSSNSFVSPGVLFARQTATSRRYDEQDGLANDIVIGILEDGQGRLWLSTLRGLSRFDPEKGTFKNYDADNGLHLRTRDGEEVALRSSDGEMF